MPINYISFPRTETPQEFYNEIFEVFNNHFSDISSENLDPHLKSNQVLEVVIESLKNIGFLVEGKPQNKIHYIDSYHTEWKCGLKVEAGRAWTNNAVHRNLIQGLVMTDVDFLVIAVPNLYRPSKKRPFDKTKVLAEALYGHSRIKLPYRLLIIGY